MTEIEQGTAEKGLKLIDFARVGPSLHRHQRSRHIAYGLGKGFKRDVLSGFL